MTESSKSILIAEEKFIIEKDENNNEKVIVQEKHNFKGKSGVAGAVTNSTTMKNAILRKNSSTAALVIETTKKL